MEITSIDKEKCLISGEFNFKGTYNNTGNIYTVTDGKFIDFPLEIPDK